MIGTEKLIEQEAPNCWYSPIFHSSLIGVTPLVIDRTKEGAHFFLIHSFSISQKDGAPAPPNKVIKINNFVLLTYFGFFLETTFYGVEHFERGPVMTITNTDPDVIVTFNWQFLKKRNPGEDKKSI